MPSGRDVRFTEPARIDLRSIEEYTETTWGREQRLHYVAQLRQAIARLSQFPYSGRVRTEIRSDVRSTRAQDHVILYAVYPDHVRILRIVHRRADTEESCLPGEEGEPWE
jgi:toxin ParE1/3/4